MENEVLPNQFWTVPPNVDVKKDILHARLDFYSGCIMFHRVSDEETSVRPVSPIDVARAFAIDVSFSSGLLPESALWYRRDRNGQEFGFWRPPQKTRVALQLEVLAPPVRYEIPTPGLVFICREGRPPLVYAATKRPTKASDVLYKAPFYNVFRDGEVCPGSHKFPDELSEIPTSFFQSLFSAAGDSRERSKRFPDKLEDLWKFLDGKAKYPLRDLVEWGHMADLIEERTS